MTRLTALPPELVDEAIDHLWNDIRSLQSCSLVCKAWLPSSRLRLFRTIRLRKADDCAKLSSIVESSPIIARCVRKLTVSAEYAGVDRDNQPVGDDAWVNDASEVLLKPQSVHTLAISRVRWDSLNAATKAAFISLFKSVKTLLLFEVKFEESKDVLYFLSMFPNLNELYFHGVSWARESIPHPSHPPTPTRTSTNGAGTERMHLTYLFLDSKSSPTLVTEWLLNHPSEPRLRNIQLCWRDMEDAKSLGDLLQASGSELESLRVEFPSGLSEEALLQNQLTLAHNTGLRTLHFGGLNITASTSRTFLTNRLFPWVVVMLSQIRSPLLTTVHFELELRTVADLKALDWVRIDWQLARREFHGLEVWFVVCVNGDEDERVGYDVEKEVRKEIEGSLPGFMQRGTLRISCY
ncbi:hypothetical protein K474DRAFT_1191003 [Panus rudis PR-1116 ss-1]|nr:hypothetical protein K474DRAFT_1191003 [Panus rudis PR-1116 ss-1]